MAVCVVWAVLSVAALLAPRGAAAGERGSSQASARLQEGLGVHRLHYEIKVFSKDGSVAEGFLAEGYLDGKLCLQYDSEEDKTEPQGPCAETHLGAAMDTETMNFKNEGMDLRVTLSHVLKMQHQKRGLHSLQETLGCEFKEDSGPRGFWDYCYNGMLFVSYHPETQTWTGLQSSAQSLAVEIEKTWATDGDKHKHYSHRVQTDICRQLQSYLASGSVFVKRTVSPAVNVTSSKAMEGNVTLTCRAVGFYPWKISLTWLRDGKPLSMDSQDHGCILPDGNGTYETWVSTRLPEGEKQRYSCHVEHSGQNSTYAMSDGVNLVQEVSQPSLVQERSWAISCAVLGAAVVMAALTLACYKKKKPSDVESPEQEQLQDLRGHQKTTADHNGTVQLVSQPLLSAPEFTDSSGSPRSLQLGTLDSTPC